MQSTFYRASHWLALICRLVAGVALIGLLGVTMADVSTRYLSRLTEGAIALRVSGSVELVSYLMLFALLAAMAANVEKSQVVVEAFSHRLPQAIKNRVQGVFLLGFMALGLVLFVGLLDSAAAATRHGGGHPRPAIAHGADLPIGSGAEFAIGIAQRHSRLARHDLCGR